MSHLDDLQALHRAVAEAPEDMAPRHILADFLMGMGGDNWDRGERLHEAIQSRKRVRVLGGPARLTPNVWGVPRGVAVSEEWAGFPSGLAFNSWADFARLAPGLVAQWPVMAMSVFPVEPVQAANREWTFALASRLANPATLSAWEVPAQVAVWGMLRPFVRAVRKAGSMDQWVMVYWGSRRRADRALSRALVCHARDQAGMPQLRSYPALAPVFRRTQKPLVWSEPAALPVGRADRGPQFTILSPDDFMTGTPPV